MPLSDLKIKALKPAEKAVKVSDEKALFLLVKPNGSKLWQMKYRYQGREGILSFGAYPDTSLKLARELRDVARGHLAAGRNPGDVRKAEKAATEHSFQSIAEEWLDQQARRLSEETISLYRGRLTDWLFKPLGKKAVDAITAPDLLAVLRAIERQERYETAHRVMARYSAVARFAIATGRATRDVSRDLTGALVPVKTKHFASIIEPKKVGQLLLAVDTYIGQPSVHYALRLAPLVFVRPGELRAAEWSEIDLDAAEWRIPAEKMKGGEPHIVPLSKQAVAILRELQPITGDGKYLFPSLRSYARPISDNTVNAALRRMGYSTEEMTGHGFRSMASTLLNERGFNSDWIEAQLAHKEPNKVRASYNFARHLDARRKMMQAWANYLDELRQGAREGRRAA